jgi:hypothetical protein
VQPLPHARLLPLVQATPAGDPGAEPELLGQVRPGDPRVQDEQDPLQRLSVGQPLSARIAKASLPPRKQRLDELPQLLGHDPRRDGHWHPSQLDDRCRRPSSPESRSLHSEISSKAFPAQAELRDHVHSGLDHGLSEAPLPRAAQERVALVRPTPHEAPCEVASARLAHEVRRRIEATFLEAPSSRTDDARRSGHRATLPCFHHRLQALVLLGLGSLGTGSRPFGAAQGPSG